MNEIISIVLKLVAAVLALLISYGVDKWVKYLTAKKKTEESGLLDDVIYTFVAAADQLLKADDPSGQKRLTYVEQNLKSLGYEITDYVRAAIEANVFAMPHTDG